MTIVDVDVDLAEWRLTWWSRRIDGFDVDRLLLLDAVAPTRTLRLTIRTGH